MKCFTCEITKATDSSYPVRTAVHGEGSGRCLWHAWDADRVFVCSHCKTPQFPEQVAWCVKTNTFICTRCAPSRVVSAPFWFWKGYTTVTCPRCGEEHPTLNRQEFEGEHPWQVDPPNCQQFPIWYRGTLIREEDVHENHKIACPSCRTSFLITQPGIYQCPRCHEVMMVRKK